jgi:arginine exporter protein ArgO
MKAVVRLIGIAALAYFGWKFLESQREEYMGLTESEAKAKMVAKLRDKVGEETAEQIAEQVVPKLRERGMLQPDPV